MADPTCTFHLPQAAPPWPLCGKPAVLLTSPLGHAGYCLEHALKEGRLAPGYRLLREEEYAELCARAWGRYRGEARAGRYCLGAGRGPQLGRRHLMTVAALLELLRDLAVIERSGAYDPHAWLRYRLERLEKEDRP